MKNDDQPSPQTKGADAAPRTESNRRNDACAVTEIYTDGACHPNPGRGGWAAIIRPRVKNGERATTIEISGWDPETTSNRMELVAAIRALQELPQASDEIVLYTDSTYLQHGVTRWLASWKANGWKAKHGEKRAVKNKDLWIELESCLIGKSVRFEWVKGHSIVDGNNRAHFLAEAAARGAKSEPKALESKSEPMKPRPPRYELKAPPPPTVEEITEYFGSLGMSPADAEHFSDYYEARGWTLRDGRPIVSWASDRSDLETESGHLGSINQRLTQGEAARSMRTLRTPSWIDQRRSAEVTLFHARREALLEKRGVLIKALLEPAKRRSADCAFFSHQNSGEARGLVFTRKL